MLPTSRLIAAIVHPRVCEVLTLAVEARFRLTVGLERGMRACIVATLTDVVCAHGVSVPRLALIVVISVEAPRGGHDALTYSRRYAMVLPTGPAWDSSRT